MSDGDLVKLTVNLTPLAHAALEESAGAFGDSKTDTVNRALHLYDAVVRVALDGGGAVQMDLIPGQRTILTVRLATTREIAPSS